MRRAFTVLMAAWLGAAAPAWAADSPLDRLGWLAGCWRIEGGEAGSGEQWLPLAGGTLLGVGRVVKRGLTVSHEFMQIRPLADGSIGFIAQPAGKPEATFVLQAGEPGQAVFQNLEHDFPQRVIYRLEEGGKLRARIEGQRGGSVQGVDFPMQRVACDDPPLQPEAFQGLPWGAGARPAQRTGGGDAARMAAQPALCTRRLKQLQARAARAAARKSCRMGLSSRVCGWSGSWNSGCHCTAAT